MVNSKKAIVIGASSGIGKGLAEILAKNGYRVGITGRREKNLLEIKQTNPENFLVKEFDVQNTEESIIKINELITELGGLDLLVYSSGIGCENRELDFNIEFDCIKTNSIGFTNIANHIFNYFKSQKKGQIVSISSIAGFRGNPYFPAYAATKAYLLNYVESLMIKSKKENCGITITDLRPGFIKTGHVAPSKMFWALTVEQAIKPMLKAIEKKKEVAYIPWRWWIIMVIMRHMPRWLYARLPF